MTTPARRGLVAVTAVVAGLSLAGCNGGGDDPPTNTSVSTTASSSTSTRTTSATTTAPPTTTTASTGIPDAAKQKTKEGAEAFLTYFFSEVNRSWMTPDPSALANMCAPQSQACDAYKRGADTLLARKQRFQDPPMTVDSLTWIQGAAETHVFDLRAHADRARIVNASGAVVQTVKAKQLQSECTVIWLNGRWRIQGLRGQS